MDVIDLTSDTASSIDLIDDDSLPDPAEIFVTHPAASGCSATPDYIATSIAQFLYNLHLAFPSLNFLSFHPQFEHLKIYSISDIAVLSVYQIVESVGMSTAQALIVLGAAMSTTGKDGVVQVDLNGKEKVKDEFEA
jgi:hypothetical protein